MKKVILDQEKCIGCGACVAISPENFDFEGNLSKLIDDKVYDKSVEAAEACPVLAITIEGDECGCADGEDCTCGDTCECEACHCEHCSDAEEE